MVYWRHFIFHKLSARKTDASALEPPSEVLQENPYATPSTLVNHLIYSSPALTELLVTREWLQGNAPSPQIIESASAYRNFTRLGILHKQRLAAASETQRANLVNELDPDVLVRESGVIAAEDAVSLRYVASLDLDPSFSTRHTKKL